MIKKMIASCLFAAGAMGAGAAISSQMFSYASDSSLDTWGKGKSEIYDVAIRIEDPALIGKKITEIKAVVGTADGIENTSLWLSRELKLEKVDGVKVNIPDTYSAAVVPQVASMPGADSSWGILSVALDSAYEITSEGIYVGYSLTVPAVEKGTSLTDGQKTPVVMAPSDNPLSLYLRASKDILSWMPYNGKLGAAAAIYVTVEGEFAPYSVALNSLEKVYAKISEDFAVRASVSNTGASEVRSIEYSYTVAGGSHEGTVEFADPLKPNLTGFYSVELPIGSIDEYGDYVLDITLTKVNGEPNVNVSASDSCQVKVLPFVPVHRPMLEEFTGLWCGWCTRGYYAMEQLSEIFGDAAVLAAYHNGDPMQVTDTYPVYVDGFPSATLNRQGTEDPYYGWPEREFGMKNEMKASAVDPVLAAIDLAAIYSDEELTKISVTATSTFLEEQHEAGYKVGFLLICNGLSAPNWLQTNYFPNYASEYAGTELEVLTTWAAKVQGLVFNDVVVDCDGMMGVEGSVPSEIAFNTPYTVEFAFDIAGNALVQDKDNVYVAAFIINPDGSILNSNKTKVVGASSIRDIDADLTELSAEYYSLSGARVAAPASGLYIKVARMSDGSTRASKVVR